MHTKITYRPEIDGLRAVAVFAVIFYHSEAELFGFNFFPGGFIGVDIFFVISGYLITSLILKELYQNNSFLFLNFYERRIRRIIPALLTVMLFTLPMAWLYMMPVDLVEFSKSILYSLGFSSNYYFYLADVEYNAQSSLLKPFLHTWSLSVEEQYYIIFPIILIILFKFLRKYILFFLSIIFLISLTLASVTIADNFSLNFYSIHSRIWQLISGSILAYLEIKKGLRSKNNSFNEFFPAIGLLLIFYSFIFYNDKMLHPTFFTSSPLIGVCLIIWFANKKGFLTKILSSKVFVTTGLISYSLYLWHFPIFAFAKIIEFTEGNLLKKALLIIITIIVSKISYSIIEKKFRNNKIVSTKVLFLSIASSISFIIIFVFFILQNDGYKKRLPEILKHEISLVEPWKVLKDKYEKSCWKRIERHCVFNPSGDKEAIIIGDSHIATLSNNLNDKLQKNDFKVKVILFGGCWYLPNFNKYNEGEKIDKFCNAENQNKIRDILLKNENSTIIIGGRLPVYLTSSYFDNQEGGKEFKASEFGYFKSKKNIELKDGIVSSINELLEKNHKIILIYPIPEVGWNVPKKINSNWKNRFFNNNHKKKITTSFSVYKERSNSSFELLDSIVHKNIYRVYPHKLFCDTEIKGRCMTHDDKNVFYADDDHPSKISSEKINNLIMKEINKISLNK